jgi:hypothetical protein
MKMQKPLNLSPSDYPLSVHAHEGKWVLSSGGALLGVYRTKQELRAEYDNSNIDTNQVINYNPTLWLKD